MVQFHQLQRSRWKYEYDTSITERDPIEGTYIGFLFTTHAMLPDLCFLLPFSFRRRESG